MIGNMEDHQKIMKPIITSTAPHPLSSLRHSFEKLMFGYDQQIVQAAIDLENWGAWPANANNFNILIGDGAAFDTSFGRHAKPMSENADPFVPSHQRIIVGRRFFETPVPSILIQQGFGEDLLLCLSLGHETFHMTEVERQAACGVTYKSVGSGFAKSVREEMSSDWLSAAISCAAFYRGHTRRQEKYGTAISQQALAASDAVSEGCADLIGLRIAMAIHGNQPNLGPALAAARLEAGNDLSQYQSGEFLYEFISNGEQLSFSNIVIKSWEYARKKLEAAPDCQNDMKDRLANVKMTFSKPLDDLNLSRQVFSQTTGTSNGSKKSLPKRR